jgi:hypothetical protein
MSKRIKITQDDKNFNRHTEDGMALLKKSVSEVGVIESITVASDGKIISGNAREETFNEILGDVEPIVVETDGTQPVVIKRTDIESGTEMFYKAAILANTTSKKNIDLDESLIKEVAVKEFKINVQELGVDEHIRFNANFDKNNGEFDGNIAQFPITIISNQEEFDKWLAFKKRIKTDSDYIAFIKMLDKIYET